LGNGLDSTKKKINREAAKNKGDKDATNVFSIGTGECYAAEAIEELLNIDLKPVHINKVLKLLQNAVNTKNFSMFPLPEEVLKQIKALDNEEDPTESIKSSVKKDLRDLKNMLKQEEIIGAAGPYFDGMFGGKSCIGTKEKIITSHSDIFNKDEGKYTHNKQYKKTTYPCHIHICLLQEARPGVQIPVLDKCIYISWGAWGDWSSCDKKCDEEGKRTRTRKCMATCTNTPAEDDSMCPPYLNEHDPNSPGVTTTETTSCTPCPPEVYGEWSQWSEWKHNNVPICNKDPANPIKHKKYRTRTCQTSGEQKSCRPNRHGKTTGEEVDELHEADLPPCKPGVYDA